MGRGTIQGKQKPLATWTCTEAAEGENIRFLLPEGRTRDQKMRVYSEVNRLLASLLLP